MEFLTGLFEGIGLAFTSYAPDMTTGLYQMFINTFATVTVSEGVTTVTGPNALGYTAIGLFGIGLVSGLFATVLGVLKLRRKKGSRRRRARA